MRTALLLVAVAAGCHLIPPTLPSPPPAPPGGDSVCLFGDEVPSMPAAVRDAFSRRVPPGTPYREAVDRLAGDGFPVWSSRRVDGGWEYTVAAPALAADRWGLVQDVRVRLTERGGAEEAWVAPARRLPESAILEECAALRHLPGMTRDDAGAALRGCGFKVRPGSVGWDRRAELIYARRWAAPSPHAASALLACRVEGGRVVSVYPLSQGASARGFDGLVGLFPDRDAPATEQARAYALLPVWTAGLFGLGMLQFMFLPASL